MHEDTTQAWLDRWDSDRSLETPANWQARAAVLERIDACWPASMDEADAALPARVQALRARLERAETAWHRRLRAAVRAGHGPRLFRQWQQDASAAKHADDADGYDALDDLAAGVFALADPGAELLPLAPEMVFYQPTPVRHVLDMLVRTGLGAGEVLVDLGSGLGQVPLLAAACTGARALGIEWQPAYVACARRAAHRLGLREVTFLTQDARVADLSVGTVFFLYTPFRGAVLRTVLDGLRAQAARRTIRLCSFGPCTATLAGEPWLCADGPLAAGRLAVFHTR